jgi:hypothetical protein
MRQFAWLELYRGMWHLLTDIESESVKASRKWEDVFAAISELRDEGWTIAGSYPNELSDRMNLGNKYQGYALLRILQ